MPTSIFRCTNCHSDRFIRCEQWLTTCTAVETDPHGETPLQVRCVFCGAIFQQTPDWSWELFHNPWDAHAL